jgi:hypothetical protein
MSRQAKSDKPDEYSSFETALKKVLSVPGSKIKSKLAQKRKKVKPSSASRVANVGD